MKAEYIWFHAVVIIVLVLALAVFSANVYYFNLLRQNPTTNITKTAALVMMVLNAIMIGLSLIVLIWAIARIILEAVSIPSVGTYPNNANLRQDPNYPYRGY